MDKEAIREKLKQKLEEIDGIINVKLHSGNFRGKNQENPYIEYTINSTGDKLEKDETNSYKVSVRFGRIIETRFPELKVEYTQPDALHNHDMRRIILNMENKSGLPSEKEKYVYEIAKELIGIVLDYQLRKKRKYGNKR